MARAAKPSGGPRPDLVHKAICAGHFGWLDKAAEIVLNDPEMENFTLKGVKDDLRQYAVQQGHRCVRWQNETAEYWLDQHTNPYWYKVILPVPLKAFPRGLFVKLRLADLDEDQPWATIISCHKQRG